MISRAICWIRRDLRLQDHAVLAEASAYADEVAVAFVFDTTILDKLQDRDDRRVSFIHDALTELDRELRARGSLLIVRYGDPQQEIPKLARLLGANDLFFGRDYEPSAQMRDAAVADALSRIGVRIHEVKDHVIFDGDEVLTGAGKHFKVYTPYRNAWMKRLVDGDGPEADAEYCPDLSRLIPASKLRAVDLHDIDRSWSLHDIGFQYHPSNLVEAGRSGGRKALDSFQKSGIDRYHEQRDIPSIHGTSLIGIHLRFGTVSVREVVRKAREHHSVGSTTWLNEIIWRDFFQMTLSCNPNSATESLRPEFRTINWPGTEEHFQAWTRGETGYPIVDAAMRAFNETGWMHNRLRMIVASFLVKDLLVDWRWGERYFARYLLDYDLAANVGNWQWAASTGTDAQPWFRIFNPVTQSRRFDNMGNFIRRHLPELAGFANRDIHWPASLTLHDQQSAGCLIGRDYPAPIVDHAIQRERALALFRNQGIINV